jgi:hypothetical protein
MPARRNSTATAVNTCGEDPTTRCSHESTGFIDPQMALLVISLVLNILLWLFHR